MADAFNIGPAGPSPDLRRQRFARLRKARQLRWRHRFRRLKRAFLAAFAILVGALLTGLFAGGIGIEGFLLTILAMMTAFVLLAIYPRTRAPTAEDLRISDLPTLVGRTEIWLESQRGLLPRNANALIDLIGNRLEQLSPQLATLGEADPAASDVRKLLGEHLPALVNSYARIPDPLRYQPHAGSTPETQLVEGLEVIAGEIDTMTRQIARGELDALATRGRYLESRYSITKEDRDA
jgi:hypothetical protein